MRNNVFSASRKRFISSSGSSQHVLYEPSVAPDGSISLRKSGIEDTDQIIESYRFSTELSTILSRFANGETDVLNRYQGYYADLTQMPKDYRSALDSVLKAESAFMVLPQEIREKYGNDWSKWLSAAGSKEWLELMGLSVEKPVEPIQPIEKEVSVDEQEH